MTCNIYRIPHVTFVNIYQCDKWEWVFLDSNGCKGAVTVCKYTLWVNGRSSEVRKQHLKVPEMKYWVK